MILPEASTEDQDLVGFFWLELSSSGDNGVGIKMEGKVFVRLEADMYTDDRFALDSYHAAKEGISVTEIIKKREEEKRTMQQCNNHVEKTEQDRRGPQTAPLIVTHHPMLHTFREGVIGSLLGYNSIHRVVRVPVFAFNWFHQIWF